MEHQVSNRQKIVVVGAGPVGCLAGLYAAKRGYEVEIYELRQDCRLPSSVPLNFTKSISLTLSTRGLEAIRCSDDTQLYHDILVGASPVHSRLVHGVTSRGGLTQTASRYDVFGGCLHVVDRSFINKRLLDSVESHPNVRLFFEHKLISCDLDAKTAVIEAKLSAPTPLPRRSETQSGVRDKDGVDTTSCKATKKINYDILIGADGAYSLTRQSIGKQAQLNLQQQWIDVFWCEFIILPDEHGRRKISGEHLHIWPQDDHMFIALPDNKSNSFTCNLFGPRSLYNALEADPRDIVAMFTQSFPGVVPDLIGPDDLINKFRNNPHFPLLDVRCFPFNYQESCVLVGDASHTMVPFYGQGLNTGFEDVHILFEKFLDVAPRSTSYGIPQGLFDQYSAFRMPDVHTVNQLALDQYHDMRVGTRSRASIAQKWIDETVSQLWPSSGWRTLYHRVAFSTERYSVAKKKHESQKKLLWKATALTAAAVTASVTLLILRHGPL